MSSSTENKKEENKEETKFIVTPWDTSGKIDYNKLVVQFGTELIDQALLEKYISYAIGLGLAKKIENNIFNEYDEKMKSIKIWKGSF